MMKNIQQISKRRAGMIGMICLLAGLLTSCTKDHNDYVEPAVALLSVSNASPDSQPLDFFLDQNRANVYPIKYGHTMDYIRAYPGKRTAIFYLTGTQQKLKSDTVTLKANKIYSLFLTNLAATPDYVLLADSIVRPATGMAAIRLVNLSPDAPAVDLAINGGAVLAANKAYKGFSPFVSLQGGSTYTLEIRKTGTSTILTSITNVKLNSGNVFTVWVHGLAAATDDKKLTADIQTNAYYY